jgi:cation-transporting ATPase E
MSGPDQTATPGRPGPAPTTEPAPTPGPGPRAAPPTAAPPVAAPPPAGSWPDGLLETPDDGLTVAEVARRREAGLGNTPPPPTTRTYGQIVRENVFTFINNVLFVLAIALVVVGRPFDALISVAVIGTNIVVGIVQEVRAKRTLDRIALLSRPTAAVVRGGAVLEVSPDDLVLGDLLAIDAGDQVVLDGELRRGRLEVDESQLTGESDTVLKSPPDRLYSGSYATSGAGRYVARAVSGGSLANQITAGARTFRRVLTPLQREIHVVIRVVLAIVIYLEILLAAKAALELQPVGDAIAEATILVGLVPNGLFVSIAIAYALAAVRIARMGALVQQANAVESLSHVDTLCLDKTGTLTANELSVAALAPLDGDEPRFRRTLGVLVASATARNRTAEAIAAACPADPLPLAAEVPFSSVRKWSAVAFAPDAGSRAADAGGDAAAPAGILAMGAPEFLEPWLQRDPGSAARIEDQVRRWTAEGLRVLLVAGHPDVTRLRDDGDESTLPDGLRPIGLVALRDVLRTEAGPTLARFAKAGVSLRIISGDDPETVASLARQAGLEGAGRLVSGPELAAMDDRTFRDAVTDARVYGRITPDLKERIVDTLRGGGRYVAMIGDGVNDVLSLKKANLGIAMGSGSQATRGVADLILLDDSFGSLASAVEEGQRILNGMQSILKIFLSRIGALGLVILASLVLGYFPIDIRNASAITLFTVGIPTAALAILAQPGRRHSESIGRALVRFVIPASVISSLAGLVVFYVTLLMGLPGIGGPTTGQPEELVAAALPEAQTALTIFLVYSGLFLIIFVEPPNRWFAVVEPPTRDRRPTILAVALAVLFVLIIVTPAGRGLFDLRPITVPVALVIVGSLIGWLLVLRLFWRRRIIARFVSVPEGG